MSANCLFCSWTGTSSQVVDGGRCPECGSQVKYESTAPVGTDSISLAEFNRRAMIAANGIRFGYGNRAAEIISACRFRLGRDMGLTERQQQALINILHRFRAQITDQGLKDYAASRATGAD